MAKIIEASMRSIQRVLVSKAAGLAGLGLVLSGAATPANAQLTLVAPTFSVAAGANSSFDVLITNNSTQTYDLGGFSLDLSVGGSNVAFTGDSMATIADPYVFAGDSFDVAFSLPFDSAAFPGNTIAPSDLANGLDAGTTISPGATFGLANVSFSVDPGAAPGGRSLIFGDIGGLTSLSDELGGAIPLTVIDGAINVAAATTPTPAPVAAGLALMLVCAGLQFRKAKVRQ
jgi:hypothetical protein